MVWSKSVWKGAEFGVESATSVLAYISCEK